jgi:hypothetical protein
MTAFWIRAGGIVLLISLGACEAGTHHAARVQFATGNYEVAIKDSAKDKARSGLVELAFETMQPTQVGGGARIRGLVMPPDLTTETTIGVQVEAEASERDLFFHGTFDRGKDGNHFPFRLGLSVHDFELTGRASGESLTWSTVGPRIEFTPSVPIVRREAGTLSVAAMVGGGYGMTTIESSADGSEWQTNAFFFDYGIGLSWAQAGGDVELGYRRIGSRFEQSDGTAGTAIRETDVEFRGVMLSFTARF